MNVLEVFPFEEYTFLAVSLECDDSIHQAITEIFQNNGYREINNPFNHDKPWERYWLHRSVK